MWGFEKKRSGGRRGEKILQKTQHGAKFSSFTNKSVYYLSFLDGSNKKPAIPQHSGKSVTYTKNTLHES